MQYFYNNNVRIDEIDRLIAEAAKLHVEVVFPNYESDVYLYYR